MRQAMANAEVGDEQRGLDPTVNALCEEVAELLGKEAAVFLPSGSMCNQIAVRLHIRPLGDEMYLHRLAHPITAESGGAAAISGAMVMPLEGEGGIFTGAALRAHMRDPADRHEPRSRLVMVEQTTNLGGGRVWPLAQIEEVLDVAKEFGLRTHLDGARLLNATVASGESAAAYAAGFETAWIDFSKGLGAPIGACLAGSDELIEEAWRYKQMLGGSMRQAGIRRRRGPLRPPAQRRAPRRGPRQRQVPRRGPGRDRRRRDRPRRQSKPTSSSSTSPTPPASTTS